MVREAGQGALLDTVDAKKIGVYLNNSNLWHSILEEYFPAVADKYQKLGLTYGSHVFRAIYVASAVYALQNSHGKVFSEGRLVEQTALKQALLGHENTSNVEKYSFIYVSSGESLEILQKWSHDSFKLFQATHERVLLLEEESKKRESEYQQLMKDRAEERAQFAAMKEKFRLVEEAVTNKRKRGEEPRKIIEILHEPFKGAGAKMSPEEAERRKSISLQWLQENGLPITNSALQQTGLSSDLAAQVKKKLKSQKKNIQIKFRKLDDLAL